MVHCNALLTFVTRVMSLLPEYDTDPLSDDTEEGRCPQVVLVSTIDLCSTRLLALVSGSRIGIDKPLELVPASDELICVRGYLLAWRLLLKYLQYSSTEVGVVNGGLCSD